VLQAAVGREVRIIRTDAVIYFESDSRYTRVVHEGLHHHLEDHHRLARAWGPEDKVRHAQVRAVEDVRHGLPLLGVQLGLQPRGA
jgi:hypothetical protein